MGGTIKRETVVEGLKEVWFVPVIIGAFILLIWLMTTSIGQLEKERAVHVAQQVEYYNRNGYDKLEVQKFCEFVGISQDQFIQSKAMQDHFANMKNNVPDSFLDSARIQHEVELKRRGLS